MAGYSLQQLQQMGATPVDNSAAPITPTPNQGGGYTADQLMQMGAKPTDTIAPKPLGSYGDNVQKAQESAIGDIKSSFNQIVKGANQPNEATKPTDVIGKTAEGAANIFSGAKGIFAGILNLAGAPASAAIETTGEAIPAGGGQNIGDKANQGVQLAANFFGSSPQLQRVTQLYPNIVKDLGDWITIGTAFLGGEESTRAVPQALDNVSTKVAPIIETVKNTVNDMNPISTDIRHLAPEQQQVALDTARQNVADAYQKSLPLTATQVLKESNLLKKTGDNAFTTYAKYNINPAAEDAIPQLQTLSDKFHEATELARQNENSWFDIEDIRKNAYDSINNDLSSASERKAAQAKIDTEIADLQTENPNAFGKNPEGKTVVTSDIVERLRKTGNDWAQYNKLNPDSVKNATGDGLANAVRDQVEKEGTFPAYREANREWSKVIHAQEILQKIEDSGKPFKRMGGLAGSVAQKVLSGVLGYSSAGIGGAILSELGTEYASKILSNPEWRTYFDRQLIEKFGNTEATPQSIQTLTDQIKAYMDNNKEHPVLQTAPITPEGNAEMGSYKLGKNPKTGRVEPTGQYRKPNVPFYRELNGEMANTTPTTMPNINASNNAPITDIIPETQKKSSVKKGITSPKKKAK